MKKNRNAFFAENNMNFQGYNPMVANAPYQNVSANSSFYSNQGPMPMQMSMQIPTDYNELSERLAKVERQISRLEHRLSAIEANTTKSTDDFESTTNNMYII